MVTEQVLAGHGGDVKCVDWHPHKALLVSGGWRLLPACSAACLGSVAPSANQFVSFPMWPASSEASELAELLPGPSPSTPHVCHPAGSKDGLVTQWCPKSGRGVATLHGHKGTIMTTAWNGNGNWVLTASRDQTCKVPGGQKGFGWRGGCSSRHCC